MAFALMSLGVNAVTTGPAGSPVPAYPPSCLAWPLLFDVPSGPTFSRTTSFALVDRATLQPLGYEPVELTFWRVACAGGRPALMLKISRRGEPGDRSRVVQFPNVPGLVARQGSKTGTLRLAQEPNTAHSAIQPGALIPYDVTLVVEHFYRTDAFLGGALTPGAMQRFLDPYFDFAQALEITIPNPSNAASPPIVVSIPDYDPRLYVAASRSLPASGYHAGSYLDAQHPGEGMIVDVMGGLVGDFMLALKAINLAWFTYDQAGRPFWLHGTATFLPGALEVTVPMDYFANGSFAGTAAPGTRARWGTVTVSFPDCTSMRLRYAANPNLPAPVPTGTGERAWGRMTQQDGLSCL